jgi:hypothetical protein
MSDAMKAHLKLNREKCQTEWFLQEDRGHYEQASGTPVGAFYSPFFPLQTEF